MNEGASEAVAEAKAFNALLPVYRSVFALYLHWFERLKHDLVHRDVMKTRRRFMEEESMERGMTFVNMEHGTREEIGTALIL